jgi:adenylate kinase family enzyme
VLTARNLAAQKKIVIIGPPGAGKTSLANELQSVLGFKRDEIHHLDEHFWYPGWVPVPDPVRNDWVKQIVQNNYWVIEGNYTDPLDILLPAADIVIFLDFPRYISFQRILQRRVNWVGKKVPDVAPGCPDKVDLDFLYSIWIYPYRDKVEIEKHLNRMDANKIVALKNQKDVQFFIQN